MASFGKKILSAFVEMEDQKKKPQDDAAPAANESAHIPARTSAGTTGQPDQRFTEYFDKLFSEANIPGPDYYEFSRMITAMQSIPDERARYAAAFAGLQVQGLDKAKLVSTADEYLRVLAADADRFGKTLDAALQEKVHSRTAEAEEKSKRIQTLSQEILELQSQIGAMQNEIRDAKSKLDTNSSAYAAESERRRQQIQSDLTKIENYIH